MPRLVDLLGTPVEVAPRLFAVFRQEARGEPHVHVGDVHAPDAEMALVLAKEQFTRREPCVNLWVVPYPAITATRYDDADLFRPATDRSYRFGGAYREQRPRRPRPPRR
jgi:ring-1,2-phenylacetyl-CoA epoxidase subunit PaaB